MKQFLSCIVMFSLFFACADDKSSDLSVERQRLIEAFNRVPSDYNEMASVPEGGFMLGLANVGNSCYANAAYKFFLSFDETRAFLAPKDGLDPKVEDFRQVLIRLANVLASPEEPDYQEFLAGSGARKHVNGVIMTYVRNRLWSTGWTTETNKNKQLDSGELLLCLADKFQILNDYSRLKSFDYSHTYQYNWLDQSQTTDNPEVSRTPGVFVASNDVIVGSLLDRLRRKAFDTDQSRYVIGRSATEDVQGSFDHAETVPAQELTDRALVAFSQEKTESFYIWRQDQNCKFNDLSEDEAKRLLWQPYFDGLKSVELEAYNISFATWYKANVKEPKTLVGKQREIARAWLFYVRQCSDEKKQEYLVGLEGYLTGVFTEESLREKYEERVYANHLRITRSETGHQLTRVPDHMIIEVNAMSDIEFLPSFKLSEFLPLSVGLEDVDYDLTYMITKSGGNSGGHYQYYEKRGNQIINHNDSSVSYSDWPTLSATKQGRLMVYRKRT